MTTLVLLGALACGGASSNTASDDDEASDDGGDASSSKKRKPMARPVSEEGKSWGGWRWKGKREDCFFVHKNQCFATLEDACKAAKCKMADCVQDEGAPAKVSCEK
jgi:hypothetical protein